MQSLASAVSRVLRCMGGCRLAQWLRIDGLSEMEYAWHIVDCLRHILILALFAAAAEQLDVETRFTTTGALPWYYWIGLEKSANMYYWQDGTPVNNGLTSNANPVGGMWHHVDCVPCWHVALRFGPGLTC
jgi:hypothetical protein